MNTCYIHERGEALEISPAGALRQRVEEDEVEVEAREPKRLYPGLCPATNRQLN
jgi:hypothetical protein